MLGDGRLHELGHASSPRIGKCEFVTRCASLRRGKTSVAGDCVNHRRTARAFRSRPRKDFVVANRVTRYAANANGTELRGNWRIRICLGRVTSLAKRHGLDGKRALVHGIGMRCAVQRPSPFSSDVHVARFAPRIRFSSIDGARLWSRTRHARRIASTDGRSGTQGERKCKRTGEPKGRMTTHVRASSTHEPRTLANVSSRAKANEHLSSARSRASHGSVFLIACSKRHLGFRSKSMVLRCQLV